MKKLLFSFFLLCLACGVQGQTPQLDEAKRLFDIAWDTQDNDTRINNRKKVMELAPESPYGLYCKAWFQRQNSDFQGSLATSEALVVKYPDFWQGYWSRAICIQRIAEFGYKIYSEFDYKKVVELNPKFADAYLALGRLNIGLLSGGDPKWYFDKAIQLDPTLAEAYYLRGYCKFHYSITHTNIETGLTTTEEPDLKGAMKDLMKAIELDSTLSGAYLQRGELKQELGDNRGALKDFDIAIKYTPDYSYAFYDRANLRYKMKDFRGALEDFDRFIALGKNFNHGDGLDGLLSSPMANAYFDRGKIKIENFNQKESGCQDLSKAGELGYMKAYELIKKYCQ